MPNVNATVDSHTAGIGVTTIGGKNIYYPIVSMHKSGSSSWYNYFSVFEAVTITDLDGTEHSTSTTELPSGLAVIGGFILDANGNVSTAESANGTGIFNYATGKEIKCATYSSYGLCYYPDSQFSKTGTTSRAEQTIVAKYRYTDSNGTPYYYYVGYWCEAHTKTEICVTPDTLVTLADGTKKEIQYVTYEDQLLVWDFYKGEYAVAPAAIISNHGYGENVVIALTFSDGTVVKAVNGHAFVDMTVNDMVFIDADNAESYVGHSFAKANADGYEAVTLTSYTVSSEMVEAWGVLTAGHFNCITEDMISFAGSEKELASIDYFEYGDGLKYDEATMQADIETYGVYTYEEFAQYLSEAQFEALGIKYMTITVGKGKITHDYILELINTYVK